MRLEYDKIFLSNLALPLIWILSLAVIFIYRPSITVFQSLSLVFLFVFLRILMRYLPINFSDEINYKNKDIKEFAQKIVNIYEIKLILLVVSFISLLFQLISIGFKIGLRIDGYDENAFVILLVGLIIMSYSNNIEDIVYIIHKIRLCSSTKKASPNLYYLLGYKLDKIFKNDIFGELKSFQNPMLHREISSIHSMGILAVHSSFNSSHWDGNLKKFYNGLLAYFLEKNYMAGAEAISSLSKKIGEIKLLDQKDKTYMFIWDKNSDHIDKPIEFMTEKPLEFIKANFESNLVGTDNRIRETYVRNISIHKSIKINVGNNCISLSLLGENGTDRTSMANLTIDDEEDYEFPAIENDSIKIYGELKSRILGFKFDNIKNEHNMIDRKYILANCILNEPKCIIFIIILSGIVSIVYTTLWAVGKW